MTHPPLRAKSWNDACDSPAPSHVLLSQHLIDVCTAAEHVLEATGDDQLRALGLAPADYRPRFDRCVLLAAALHDLGKANDHFQDMIYYRREGANRPQGIRHEWVTLLMLASLRDWLMSAVGDHPHDLSFVEWAIVGHHPALHHESPPSACRDGGRADIELLMGEPEFRKALEFLRTRFKLSVTPPTSNTKRNLTGIGNVFAEIAAWYRSNRRSFHRMRDEVDMHGVAFRLPQELRLVAAIKNCLIAADVAGSVLPKVTVSEAGCWDWITASFAHRPNPHDLQEIVRIRLGSDAPRPFQQAVAESRQRVTLVKAGCGSGKTLAAYMWAAQNHPARRLYFCYPTTGTATEGFKDYLFDQLEGSPRLGARLFHSRRDVDLEMLLETEGDLTGSESQVATKLNALEAWSTPIVACTVDAVLGLIQNNERGRFSWPALAQSAFVFDEIHAFDERLFGALLRFIRDLPGVPVLLMTASLQEARERILRDLAVSLGETLVPILGPPELENRPRYHRERISGNDSLPVVRRVLERGGKVLWVCNTVGRAMEAATLTANLQPLLYHSRFKYEHRVARHQAVIRAFDPALNPGKALAICTQVAEMSLDLSADLLVTDLAPVPAMIQRLGRLNRRAQEGEATKPFVVIYPEDGAVAPYGTEDLAAANQWLDRLPDASISQRHLADAWEQMCERLPSFAESAWLDTGPRTSVESLRETSPGISVLMEADEMAVRDDPRRLMRYILPMPQAPRGVNWSSWSRLRGIPIAPSDTLEYDELRGAQWQKNA